MPSRVFALFAMPAAVVFVVVLVLGLIIWWPLALLAIPAAFAVVWVLWNRADDAVLARLNARPVGQKEGERINGVVDRLCLSTGIERPDVMVVDDTAPNMATVSGRRHSLVATTGLLTALDPIELEGVVAHGLSKVAEGVATEPTLVASAPWAVPGPLRPRNDDEHGVVRFDIAGAGLTRYPPGLRSALNRIQTSSTEVAGGSELGSMWLVPPVATELPLEHRIEVLGEL